MKKLNVVSHIVLCISILCIPLHAVMFKSPAGAIFVEDFQENTEVEFGKVVPGFIQVKTKLESITSPYQKIDVYDTHYFGKMLVIDDIIMLTQRDNFAYHEMIVHPAMNIHPHPKRVLIVGGGDGGTLKEVLRYDCVQEVIMCEIDEDVINISKKYFPEFKNGFDDPRLTIIAQDAAQYMKSKTNYFDVICVDSTDPIGPGAALFEEEFYHNLHKALTEDGIAITQSESIFYSLDFITDLYNQNKKIFKHAAYYYTAIPTYPSGTIGFSFCSKKYVASKEISFGRISSFAQDLNYYNPAMHKAAFSLPNFVRKSLDAK